MPPAKPVKRLVAGHFNFLTGINRMIYVLKLNNYKYILVEKPNKERESHFCYYILLLYGCCCCCYRQKIKKRLVPYIIVYCYLTYFIYDVFVSNFAVLTLCIPPKCQKRLKLQLISFPWKGVLNKVFITGNLHLEVQKSKNMR